MEHALSTIDVTASKVMYQLSQLDETKAPGPDGIPATILSRCAEELSHPLSVLYQKSLEEGRLPKEWKLARISPIYKKGSKRKPENYRPVSLTSQTCKILERIIRSHITEHLEIHELLSEHQHGFVRKKSCLTNLLESLEKWKTIVDEGAPVDIVYCDFRKAFDTVPHNRLIKKLSAYGLKGQLLAWLGDFLQDRWQQVTVGKSESNPVRVTSGVPQGSVLGPVLFVLYVNELPELVQSHMKMFADDVKVFRGISNSSDQSALQDDLNALCNWSKDWLLQFNPKKCKVMHVGHSNPTQNYYMKQSNGTTEELGTSKLERDLGVHIADTLKATSHCQIAAKKASSALCQLRMAFPNMKMSSFRVLYTTYVRPHIEYCIQAVGPYLKKDIKTLEAVQRRATKLIRGLKQLPYEERLKRLKLMSIEDRLRRGDLIETYKILTKKVHVNHTQFFRFCEDRRTRGHSLKLEVKRSRLQCRYKSFANRVVVTWNQLPEEVVSASSINSFKNQLDRHWAAD